MESGDGALGIGNGTATTPSQGDAPRGRVRAEQSDLALAWMAAAFAGGAAITLMPETAGAWRNLAPLVAMLGYLLFAFTRSRYSTLRVADSAYFMGFLWTLWALITALVWHKALKAADLYPVFGYALITTASGMFVRMALIQFYRTAEDQTEQAVDVIDLRVDGLVKELERAQASAAELRLQGAEALRKWHVDFAAASVPIVAEIQRATAEIGVQGQELAASIKAISQTVGSTGRVFGALEKRVTGSTDRIAIGMDRAAGSLEASVNGLVKRVDGVHVPADLLQAKIEEVLRSIETSVKPIADKAAASVVELTKAVNEVGQAIIELPKRKDLEASITNLTTRLAIVTTSCEELGRQAKESAASLSAIGPAASGIAGALGGVKSQVGEIQRGLESAHGTVVVVGVEAKKAGAAIVDVVQFVRSNVTR